MTNETKSLIDGLESHYWPCPKCKGEGSTLIDGYYEPCSKCDGNGSIADMVLMKSDVIDLVEKLTKQHETEIETMRQRINEVVGWEMSK